MSNVIHGKYLDGDQPASFGLMDWETTQSDVGLNNTHRVDVIPHFNEGSIDHTAISNVGSLSHATIDTYLNQDVTTTGEPAFKRVKLSITDPAPSHEEGKMFYDNGEHTLAIYNDEVEVTHQLGQEGYIRIYNNTGSAITDGKVVYITGTDGIEGRPTIGLAKADATMSSQVIGLTTHTIEDATFGYITFWGIVNDIDTSTFSPGARLFLSETVAGDLTNTKPISPNFEVPVGYCITSNVSTGRILVNIQAGGGTVISGDASELVVRVQKGSAGTISLGQLVYISGWDNGAGVPEVELADSSLEINMPAFGVTRSNITNSSSGNVVVAGKVSNLDTSSFSPSDKLYVSETAGELTNIKPTGTALVQKIGVCLRSHASFGSIEVFGAGRSNDLPNLAQYNVWTGDSNGVPVASQNLILENMTVADAGTLQLGTTNSVTQSKCVSMIFIADVDITAGMILKIVDDAGVAKVAPIAFDDGDNTGVIGISMQTVSADADLLVCIGGIFSVIVQNGALVNIGNSLEKSDVSGQDGRAFATVPSAGTFCIALTSATGNVSGTNTVRAIFKKNEVF